MAVEDVIKLVKKVATEVIPDSVAFTDVRVEASNVVLYTPNVEIFSDNNDLIRNLAQKVRKRIVIKADPSVRKPVISAPNPTNYRSSGFRYGSTVHHVQMHTLCEIGLYCWKRPSLH